MSEVQDYLISKGIQLRPGTGDNSRTTCFFHGEEPGKRGRLYVNTGTDEKTAGLYKCFICDAHGNLRTLRRHFGDETLSAESDFASQHSAIMGMAAAYYASVRDSLAMDFLQRERGLTIETIRKHELGFAPGDRTLYNHLKEHFSASDIVATGLVVERSGRLQDFLQQQVTIPYHLNGMVVAIRGREIGGKYVTLPGTKGRLFNVDAAARPESDVLVFTEGEFDALVLEQLGFAAIGVPGAATFQLHWADYCRDARRVYVIFDPDEAGQRGAERVLSMVGAKAKAISLPIPDQAEARDVDPSYFVTQEGWGYDDFEALFRQANRVNSLLISVNEAITEWDDLQGAPGVKLGFPLFDEALKPGLRPGQVMVPLAKTSSGKTLLLLNFMQRAAEMQKRPLNMLLVSLEQTRSEWFERARRLWFFYNPCEPARNKVAWAKVGVSGRESLHQWITAGTRKFWEDRLYIVDKNRLTEDQLHLVIEEYKETVGVVPDLMLVDYLGYYAMGATGNSRYEKVSNAIMSLKAVGKEWRVPIISPHQVNRSAEFGTEFGIDQARDAGVVEETADFAMTMWNVDDVRGNEQGRKGQLALKIGKSRHGGKGKQFFFQMGYLSLVIAPTEDTIATRRLANEAEWVEHGLPWDAAIYHHHLGVDPKLTFGPP